MHGCLVPMDGTELNLDAMIKIVNAYMEENGITHEKQFEIYYSRHRASLTLPLFNTITPLGALLINTESATHYIYRQKGNISKSYRFLIQRRTQK